MGNDYWDREEGLGKVEFVGEEGGRNPRYYQMGREKDWEENLGAWEGEHSASDLEFVGRQRPVEWILASHVQQLQGFFPSKSRTDFGSGWRWRRQTMVTSVYQCC